MLRLHRLSFIGLLLVLSSRVSAQTASDSGSFLVRHAGDTVAVERFSRSATQLEGTLALRGKTRVVEHYTAVIAPDATLPLIEVSVRQGSDTGETRGKVVQRARVIFKGDSVAVDELGRAGLITRVFGTEAGAIPYLNLSFALLEQAVRRMRAVQGRSRLALFNLGGGQTVTTDISALGSDSLELAIGDVRFHLRVDTEGKILGGRIPSQNVIVDRE